jgi:hypothetical protein
MSNDACVNITSLLDLAPGEKILKLTSDGAATVVDTATTLDLSSYKTDLQNKTLPNAAFFTNFSKSYNYYNIRYKCAITKYLSNKTSEALSDVQILNKRMFALLTIYKLVKDDNTSNTTAGNALNTEIQKIKAQMDLIKQIDEGNNSDDIYARMIEYTKEKANVTNNLMQLYGFLNIVAIGMLFYIYRST